MAYIDFQELGGAPAAGLAGPSADPTPSAPARLTALEWSVVTLARKDGRATLRAPGRLARAWRAVLRQTNPRLADARLEALRRMAVLAWRHGYTVPSREVEAFLAAGFNAGQYETMVDRIDATRMMPLR